MGQDGKRVGKLYKAADNYVSSIRSIEGPVYLSIYLILEIYL